MTTSFINKTVNRMLFAYGLVNRDINNFELKIQKCTQEACRAGKSMLIGAHLYASLING